MATNNADITVSVVGNAGQVSRTNFGRILLATAAVEATFDDTYRVYQSNNEAQNDDDLSTSTKSAIATYYSQTTHPTDIIVGEVEYESAGDELKDSLTSIETAMDSAGVEQFYGIACMSRADADVQAVCEWAAANNRLALAQTSAAAVAAATGGNVFETLNTASNTSAGIWYSTDTDYADLAWLAKGLSADLETTSTVWYDKTLTGISVDNGEVDSTEKGNIEGYNGNHYLTLLSVGATAPGTCFDGTWIDEKVYKDFVKARVKEGIAQLKLDLSERNKKIPYTNPGLAMLGGVIRKIYSRSVGAGHAQADSLTLSIPDISTVSSASILAREATISATWLLSGGVKDVSVTVGVLNYQ